MKEKIFFIIWSTPTWELFAMAHLPTGKFWLFHLINFTAQSNISLNSKSSYNSQMKVNNDFILRSSLSIAQEEFAKLKLNIMKNINPKYSFSFLVSLSQLSTRGQLYKNFWELKIYKTERRISKMLRIVSSEFQ